MIVFSFVYICIVFYIGYSLYAMISGAPFVPTSHKKVKRMLDLVDLKKHEKFIDLGSGDGRLVFAAAQKCDHATGVEISPMLHIISKLKKIKNKIKNATLIRDTLWNIDLKEYDVVSIYFIPHRMKKLKKKIKREMKPGSRIVSHAFTFPDWQDVAKDDTIYIYKV
jgi:cyclopropane fatty-acyl-phospholipid synthase-like methyltransferase